MDDFQSAEETAFVVDEVTNIIKEAIEGAIGGNAYQHNKVNQWTSNVVEQCLNQLTKLGKPFKYIGINVLHTELHSSDDRCSFSDPLHRLFKSLDQLKRMATRGWNKFPYMEIFSYLCNYAKEWGRPSHSQFLLLGQQYRWKLHCEVGK